MGGSGSGNHWRWDSRDTCERYQRIELPYLRKHKMLRPGYYGQLSWNHGGEPTGSVNFRVHENSIELIYKHRNAGEDEWLDVNEHVPFAFTAQNFGGRRRWFVCLSCGRKCAVLYGGTHYRCRKCWNLAYQSQNESPLFRALSQAQKYRRRLGGSECTDDPFPQKPRGMHWRKYDRIRQRGEALDERVDRLAAAMLGLAL